MCVCLWVCKWVCIGDSISDNCVIFMDRYMKGTQERGLILGSVEDIVLTLDDNAMNLQSMSASRFVGAFIERVQKWEKSLSHISEVVDVST